MKIYLAIFGISFIFAFIDIFVVHNSNYKNTKRVYLIIATIFLLFFAGSRRECGYDYDAYVGLFNIITPSNWYKPNETLMEIGYGLLCLLSYNEHVMFLIMAILSITTKIIFFDKISPYPLYSLFLFLSPYIYPQDMGQMRQAVAIGMVLFAFINRGNLKRFIFFIFMATMFHTSAILALIAYKIPDQFLSRNKYIILLLIAAVFNGLSYYIIMIISTLLPAFLGAKINLYANSGVILGFDFATISRMIIFILLFIYRDRISQLKNGAFFSNILFLFIFLYMALGSFPQIAGRGTMYFRIIEWITIPFLISCVSKRNKIIYGTAFLLIFAYMTFKFFKLEYSDYIPYNSWLF